MSYLTREEVLRHFSIIEAEDGFELYFEETGRRTRVMWYVDEDQAEEFWLEDALAYWMKALNRTWDDDDLFDPVEFEKPGIRKFVVED